MQIFLAPRSNETSYKNFLSTIENGVDYTIVEPFLNEDGKNILSKKNKLFVWGNKEAKKSSWDKMNENDLILFYKKGDFIYSGKLLYKQHSKELGLSLWPPKKGEEPWTCIFFLKDLKPINIPISVIADFGGYSEGFIVQGFMPLNDRGTKEILNKFGTLEAFIKSYPIVREATEESDLEETSQISEENAHREAQILLLKIGRLLGFDTYSPDKSQEAYDEKLEQYITVKDLPRRYIGDEILSLVRQIDIVWLEDGIPKYAFEVEHSTRLRNGFQRLYQLRPLNTKLYIIARENDKKVYDQILETDPYYRHRSSFRFRSYKQLEQFFNEVDRSEAIKKAFIGLNGSK